MMANVAAFQSFVTKILIIQFPHFVDKKMTAASWSQINFINIKVFRR